MHAATVVSNEKKKHSAVDRPMWAPCNVNMYNVLCAVWYIKNMPIKLENVVHSILWARIQAPNWIERGKLRCALNAFDNKITTTFYGTCENWIEPKVIKQSIPNRKSIRWRHMPNVIVTDQINRCIRNFDSVRFHSKQRDKNHHTLIFRNYTATGQSKRPPQCNAICNDLKFRLAFLSCALSSAQ